MVLVSVFLCLVGWFFFFPLLYFLHCCVTPTALIICWMNKQHILGKVLNEKKIEFTSHPQGFSK